MIGQQVATLQKVLAGSSGGTPPTRQNPTCHAHEFRIQWKSDPSTLIQLWAVWHWLCQEKIF